MVQKVKNQVIWWQMPTWLHGPCCQTTLLYTQFEIQFEIEPCWKWGQDKIKLQLDANVYLSCNEVTSKWAIMPKIYQITNTCP